MGSAVGKLEEELIANYGQSQRKRVQRGLKQVATFWRDADGNREELEKFVQGNFAGDRAALDTMFGQYEYLLEQVLGHMVEIVREFRRQTDLDVGPIRPYDEVFAGYDPSAHLIDDFFRNKLAFVVLLNFPLTALEERLAEGEAWTRRQWAETRLAEFFSRRIPADANLAISKAEAEANLYISSYNIWMHHLLDDDGRRLFPRGMCLLSHWNLRDEIKANYGDTKNGLARQRMISKVMQRIVDQSIPGAVVNNPQLDWNPYTNEVQTAAETDSSFSPGSRDAVGTPEPNTRYLHLLATYRAQAKADPYSPDAPTLMARRFNRDRQIPEERVEKIFEQLLSSPALPRTAELIRKRLGRPLEPFDIWYNGFRPGVPYAQQELDSIVSGKYPDAEAFDKGIPLLLQKLAFSPERAAFLAENIAVDPARGSGHAMGAAMRQAKARLRTRIYETGMNYKGFNIAIHELGHNVEQTFSLHGMDYYSLNGVPNNAFTEALAFVFQGRDLELLGLELSDPLSDALKALNTYWATCEISTVSLVDMGVWHWMYENPGATPERLRDAVLRISRDVWNRFYAPVFGVEDVTLLGIYSHMIDSFLYLPDYPLGHMIAFQLEEHMKKTGRIGPEFERVARLGRIAPDLWMQRATGSPVGPEALIAAAEQALNVIRD
ncbi:MAG: hypothetical protein JW793_02180 [Acidobacteria bacterium]|nr:hypothetical protein [Acidobacteriota bacterium]